MIHVHPGLPNSTHDNDRLTTVCWDTRCELLGVFFPGAAVAKHGSMQLRSFKASYVCGSGDKQICEIPVSSHITP